jgi:hypothetical protein
MQEDYVIFTCDVEVCAEQGSFKSSSDGYASGWRQRKLGRPTKPYDICPSCVEKWETVEVALLRGDRIYFGKRSPDHSVSCGMRNEKGKVENLNEHPNVQARGGIAPRRD